LNIMRMTPSDIQNRMPTRVRRRFRQGLYWSTAGTHALIPNAAGSYYVLGHPKSGTNWLCSVLSDYFEQPVFQAWKRLTPAMSPQIFHMHRFLSATPAKRRTFYLYRDGRDIVVSRFFAMARSPWDTGETQAFSRYLGSQMDEDRIKEQLPAFIEWVFEVNKTSSICWPDHISKAFEYPYSRLSFEAMKVNTFQEVKRAIQEMTRSEVNEEQLQKAIEKNNFERKKKASNDSHFLRSGNAGDWASYFTRGAAERFEFYAQGTLEKLGYEQDSSWVAKCESS